MRKASLAFQSNKLLVDEKEFGPRRPISRPPVATRPISTPPTYLKRSLDLGSNLDSIIQFTLKLAFGNSDFTPSEQFGLAQNVVARQSDGQVEPVRGKKEENQEAFGCQWIGCEQAYMLDTLEMTESEYKKWEK
ncbi:cytidine and dCMP deaminase domain-containing protein 1 [Striga asiatica]|uniref:Cytidine and dCMP deaminase domain-containing protein 1 n=1 Tax=Striga asiatica TaxID=4170 RepID=A0A5A7QZS5_STRAF|nr:cytidine and dCMP deaminase domain-containing protein 1 [Striga asiatica]